jgi:hypothetical protein
LRVFGGQSDKHSIDVAIHLLSSKCLEILLFELSLYVSHFAVFDRGCKVEVEVRDCFGRHKDGTATDLD